MSLYAYRHVIANERTCYWLLHRLRWPGGVECPRCNGRQVWRMDDRGRCEYRCIGCRYHFSLLTGTVLQGTRLPLTKWVLAIALLKIGISSRALARELQVSQRIAWRMLTLFRQLLYSNRLLRKLRGAVEVDDTYIGGHRKGMRGRGAAGKTVVLGLRTRRGRVRSLVIPHLKTDAVRTILNQQVARGARLYTDELHSYCRTRTWGFQHRCIKHAKRFVRGQTHTQGIEGYWGHLKPTLVARHRSVSQKHLQEYLAEADYKYNCSEHIDFIQEILHQILNPNSLLPSR
jgi:transposase-like protein